MRRRRRRRELELGVLRTELTQARIEIARLTAHTDQQTTVIAELREQLADAQRERRNPPPPE